MSSMDMDYEFDAPRFTNFGHVDDEDVSTNEDNYFVEIQAKDSIRPTNPFKKDEPSLIGCESSEDDPELATNKIRKSSRTAARRSSLVARVDDLPLPVVSAPVASIVAPEPEPLTAAPEPLTAAPEPLTAAPVTPAKPIQTMQSSTPAPLVAERPRVENFKGHHSALRAPSPEPRTYSEEEEEEQAPPSPIAKTRELDVPHRETSPIPDPAPPLPAPHQALPPPSPRESLPPSPAAQVAQPTATKRRMTLGKFSRVLLDEDDPASSRFGGPSLESASQDDGDQEQPHRPHDMASEPTRTWPPHPAQAPVERHQQELPRLGRVVRVPPAEDEPPQEEPPVVERRHPEPARFGRVARAEEPETSSPARFARAEEPRFTREDAVNTSRQSLNLSRQSLDRPSTPIYYSRNTPGYMTPTFASASKARAKAPPPVGRPMTPTLQPAGSRGLTVPHTPQLHTSARPRSNSGTLSSTTRELERIAAERRALAERKEKERLALLQARRTSVAPAKPLTMPQPFALRTDERLGQAKHGGGGGGEYVSTAALVQKVLIRGSESAAASLNASSSGHSNQSGLLTVPSAPALQTDRRLRGTQHLKSSEELQLEEIRRAKQEQAERRRREEERVVALAQRMPAAHPRPVTQPEPFALEGPERHERARRELELKAERERWEEEQKRTFRARPVAVQTAPQPVAPPQRPLTTPVAPTCLERAHQAEEQRRHKLERLRQEEEAQRHFHARALPSTTFAAGFVPQPARHEPVVPDDVELRTDRRGVERAALEQARLEAERAEQARRELEQVAERARQEQDLREYRRSLVHKPLAVPPMSQDFGRRIPDEPANVGAASQHYKPVVQGKGFGGRVARVSLAAAPGEEEN